MTARRPRNLKYGEVRRPRILREFITNPGRDLHGPQPKKKRAKRPGQQPPRKAKEGQFISSMTVQGAQPASGSTKSMASSCQALLQQHAEAWGSAVSHPFLRACKDGSIREAQFDAWLAQDGRFALEFTRCAASLLTKAPADKVDLLLGGLAALKDELQWFAALSAERGLQPDPPTHPTCQRYITFMAGLSKQPYAVHAVAFWAIERTYWQAWSSHLPLVQPYNTYAQRWGSEGFGQYVKQLETLADQELAAANEGERSEANAAFLQVCQLEQDFWNMAYSEAAT